jgi:hypothetical protein
MALVEPLIGGIPALEEGVHVERLGPKLGDLAVCATNIAFAIELYLKAILLLSNIDPGKDHKLGEIYRRLPQCYKDLIELVFEERRKKDWNGKYPSITLAAMQSVEKSPVWDDHHVRSFTIQTLLDGSSDVFISFRYLYEMNFNSDGLQYHRFEYALLLSACRALRDAISQVTPDLPLRRPGWPEKAAKVETVFSGKPN